MRNFEQEGHNIESRRTFDHRGVKVDEVVVTGGRFEKQHGMVDWRPWRKIMWALHPIEQEQIDGKDNPICHADMLIGPMPESNDAMVEFIRSKVQKVFDQHYNLVDHAEKGGIVREGDLSGSDGLVDGRPDKGRDLLADQSVWGPSDLP